MNTSAVRQPSALPDASPNDRLQVAAHQIRLASKALTALSRLVDDDDGMLDDDVARLESRAAELMRTAARLARRLGVDGLWGVDVLFHPPDELAQRRARPRAAPPLDAPCDLEPIALLAPISRDRVALPPPPQVSPSVPPWTMMTAAHDTAGPSDMALG